jgi:hypothetical protein
LILESKQSPFVYLGSELSVRVKLAVDLPKEAGSN